MTDATLAVARPTSLAEAIERQNALIEMREALLKPDVDYGIIPGTAKPTLLKPGAEKLCARFGLTPTFETVDAVRDFTGQDHGGEPLFFFEIKCRLFFQGQLVAEGVGSCNSWERKYRYRNADRLCPMCGKPCIIKGKAEYGGGYVCFAKKGGCGAKFRDGDASIEGQAVGQVPNPDIADVVNTVRKMADKRALVGATLIATGASEFFTQDIEDLSIIDVTPYQPQPVKVAAEPEPEVIPEILALQADLQLARVLLKEKGGKPVPLTQKAVDAMGSRELKILIKDTKRAIELIDQEVLEAATDA